MPRTTKLQRWVDLLSTLLGHRYPLTFEQIARDVPGYMPKTKNGRTKDRGKDGGERDARKKAGTRENSREKDSDAKERESIKRTFERDKKELKAFGIPLETVENTDGEARYRLRGMDFYLPYIAVAAERGRSVPMRRINRDGFHGLQTLTFGSDELSAIAEGAAHARQLGSAPLRDDIDSALRKLAVDRALDATAADAATAAARTRVLLPRAEPAAPVLQGLGEALHAHKVVRFDYHALGSSQPDTRTVEPYGLFFLNAHWYLVGRDQIRDAIRNFRINRISQLRQRSPSKEIAEYDIPPSFDLREHAKSRSAWELGDAEGIDAIVEFRGSTGAARAASALGEPVEGYARRRRFVVRRPDVFVRWLLALSGDAVPISPPELCAELARQIAAVRCLYPVDASTGASA